MANTQKQLQYSPVRDIQKATGTSEHTYVEDKSLASDFIDFMGTGIKSFAKVLSEKKKDKPDITPLVDAASDMADQFRNASGSMTTAQKDLISQDFYKWAYKSGYDNTDIDAVVKSQGLNELSEDITKYRKELSQRAYDKTETMVSAGYQINPEAENEQQAITAYNNAMSTRMILDTQSQKFREAKDTDPVEATKALSEMVPSLTRAVKDELRSNIAKAGGIKNLTKQDLATARAGFRENWEGQGLPDWYIDTMLDFAMMPYERIADASDDDREAATASLKTAEDNLDMIASSTVKSSVVKGKGKDYYIRYAAALRPIVGDQIIFNDTTLLDNVLTANFKDSKGNALPQQYTTEYITSVQKAPEAFANAGKKSIDSVKENFVVLNENAMRMAPSLSKAAIAKGIKEPITAKVVGSLPVVELKGNALKEAQMKYAATLKNVFMANAEEELNTFGEDRKVTVDATGAATVTGGAKGPVEERFLRNVESMIHKQALQTPYSVPQLAQMHNQAVDDMYGEDNPMPALDKSFEALPAEDQKAMQMNNESSKSAENNTLSVKDMYKAIGEIMGLSEKKTSKKTPPIPTPKPAEVQQVATGLQPFKQEVTQMNAFEAQSPEDISAALAEIRKKNKMEKLVKAVDDNIEKMEKTMTKNDTEVVGDAATGTLLAIVSEALGPIVGTALAFPLVTSISYDITDAIMSKKALHNAKERAEVIKEQIRKNFGY